MSQKDKIIGHRGQLPLQNHSYRVFSAQTESGLTEKELTNKDYWVNHARSLQPGDEIRCLAADSSYVAYLIVLFVQGNEARIKCTNFTKLEKVEEDAMVNPDYELKNGGASGWYIKVLSDGSKLFDKHYPTQAKASQALEEYLRALNN
jgi:hypothetical protein